MPGFEGSLTLNAGNSSNSILVTSTAKDTKTTANTGAGTNSILLGDPIFLFPPPPLPPILLGYDLAYFQSALTINGGAGTNMLTIDDDLNFSAYTDNLTANTLDRFGAVSMATITFNLMTTMDLLEPNPLANLTNVFGTAMGTTVTVHTGDGNDNLMASGLDNIQGPLDFVWNSGSKSLFVSNQTATNSDTYTLTADTIMNNPPVLDRTGAASLLFDSPVMVPLTLVQMNTGPNATVNIPAIASATTVEVFAGSGPASVLVANDKNNGGHDLSSIKGTLFVQGTGQPMSPTSVVLRDDNAGAGRSYLLTADQVTAAVPPSPPNTPFCMVKFFNLAIWTVTVFHGRLY